MSGAQMPDTMWTLISRAKRGATGDLDLLLKKYRVPVLAFLRRSGASPEEAEDLTQEAFLAIVEDQVLARADASKGRFRNLILAVARHTLSARRRHDARIRHGGAASTGPLIDELLAAPGNDETFDPLWVQNLVWLGMNRLREECAKDGTRYHEALVLHTTRQFDYARIAGELRISAADVKNHLHQARLRLKRHVLHEVQSYSSSRDEYESEVAYLMKFLE